MTRLSAVVLGGLQTFLRWLVRYKEIWGMSFVRFPSTTPLHSAIVSNRVSSTITARLRLLSILLHHIIQTLRSNAIMPSPAYSSYPKGCLKRPSAFPVIHPSDLPQYDHEYDISSSSMRDWDSLFTPSLPTTCGRFSRGTTGSDGTSIMSTSTSNSGSPRHVSKSVSFCEVTDVHVYTPEPLPPERPRGVVARLLQACASALGIDTPSSSSLSNAGYPHEDEDEH